MLTRMLSRLIALVLLAVALGSLFRVAQAEAGGWEESLAGMPLISPAKELNRANCVRLLLGSYRSNSVVKALVFLPGATDELYFFKRARAQLTNDAPSLFDAVVALTNQTYILATFRPPLLLLYGSEDLLRPVATVLHKPTFRSLEEASFLSPFLFSDYDWDHLLPILKKSLHTGFRPGRDASASWSFYRHSLAGAGLNGREALEAVALAGRTIFTVKHGRVIFEVDRRPLGTPATGDFQMMPRQ